MTGKIARLNPIPHVTFKESPAAGAFAFKVIHELERPLTQLQHRNIGRCAHVERPAIVERLEDSRGIDGHPRDHLFELQAEQ